MRAWFSRRLPAAIEETKHPDGTDIYQDFINFDGNSQTLRLVTRLQIINDNFGLNLTYATLAALIKYPRASTDNNHKWKKHGFFFSEAKMVQEVWAETGLSKDIRHPFTWIMEACDDIAYSVLDAEDTVKKGLASWQDLMDFLVCWDQDDSAIKTVIKKTEEKNQEWQDKRHDLSPAEINDLSMQMFRVHATNELISAVVDAFAENERVLLDSKCPFTDLISQSRGAMLCEALKSFDKTRGYRHRSVLELELKGSNYIQSLMDMLWVGIHGHKTKAEYDSDKKTRKTDSLYTPRPDHLSNSPFGRYAYSRISENYRRVFEDPDNKLPVLYKEAQLLTDAIAGMTDSYLIRLHDELKSLHEYESRLQPPLPQTQN
jgi:dGTPase